MPLPHSRLRAFTLVETIATMTVMVVLMVVISPVVLASVDGYAAAATRAEIAAGQSAALERIAVEVRNIPLQAASPARPWITSVTADSLSWGSGNSLTLSASDLQLTLAGGAAHSLLSNVQAFSVQAYDDSGAALAASLSGAQCDSVKRLQFTITVSRSGVAETVRTTVFLRCMASGASP